MSNKTAGIITAVIAVILIVIGAIFFLGKKEEQPDITKPIGTYTVTIILLSPALVAPLVSKKPSYF